MPTDDHSEYDIRKEALQVISQTEFGGVSYEAEPSDCRRLGALLHMHLLPPGYALRVIQELFDLPQKPEHFIECGQGPVLAVLHKCFGEDGHPTSWGSKLILDAYQKIKTATENSTTQSPF